MKKSQKRWILIVAVTALIATALLTSCQPAAETLPPAPPPSATPAPVSPPAEEPVPSLPPAATPAPGLPAPEEPPASPAPAEEPSPPTAETMPIIETYEDLQHLINSNPAEVDNTNLPITPTDKLGVTGRAPIIYIAEYRLTVDGLVEKPLTLTYDDILAYSPVSDVVLLICRGAFADNAEWTGVPVATILAEAGVKPEATEVVFYAPDKYRRVFPLEEVQQEGDFLAYEVNGVVLPREHGYPLRLVLEGKSGLNWVKWLDHIEVR